MNVTYLNPMLGVPLSHSHCLSSFLEVSVKPQVILVSAYTGTGTGNRLRTYGLPLI